MKAWKIILIPTVITMLIGGIYLYTVWRHRQNPGVSAQPPETDTLSKDDLVVMKQYFPQHFEDLDRLTGTTVWMKNGYTMPYFPYAGGRVQFAKRIGVIPSAQALEIKKVIKASPPASVDDGISHGTRQALVVFSLPGNKEEFATPVGVIDGNQEQYYTDMLFFYDDPHKIYDYWPKDVWSAIEQHEVKPGMSELEARMAVGQKMQTDGQKEGDRTVTYDEAGKKWIVTFQHDRATEIKQG